MRKTANASLVFQWLSVRHPVHRNISPTIGNQDSPQFVTACWARRNSIDANRKVSVVIIDYKRT